MSIYMRHYANPLQELALNKPTVITTSFHSAGIHVVTLLKNALSHFLNHLSITLAISFCVFPKTGIKYHYFNRVMIYERRCDFICLLRLFICLFVISVLLSCCLHIGCKCDTCSGLLMQLGVRDKLLSKCTLLQPSKRFQQHYVQLCTLLPCMQVCMNSLFACNLFVLHFYDPVYLTSQTTEYVN